MNPSQPVFPQLSQAGPEALAPVKQLLKLDDRFYESLKTEINVSLPS